MKKMIIFFSIVGALTSPLFLAARIFLDPGPGPAARIRYGITWSRPYAKDLGIDSDEGLRTALRELAIGHVRLPAYWTDVEPTEGVYDWSGLKQQIDIARDAGADVTLILGGRQVRWPECWIPDWAKQKTMTDRERAQIAYIKSAYRVFKDDRTIVRWQVENEAGFPFGECQEGERAQAIREIAMVKAWEQELSREGKKPRPVVTTDAGEWATWLLFAGHVDGLGSSLYRKVLMPNGTFLSYWFFQPGYYALRAQWLRPFVGPVYFSEVQMEPWASRPLFHGSTEQDFFSFTVHDMRKTFAYAKRSGFKEIDFWGAEWWYFMKEKRGREEYWNTMQELLEHDTSNTAKKK